jgi:hypothetical protein
LSLEVAIHELDAIEVSVVSKSIGSWNFYHFCSQVRGYLILDKTFLLRKKGLD